MKKFNPKEKTLGYLVVIGGLMILSIPVWMGVGKVQLCKYYFSEMNPMACFFTQLPAVVVKR